MDLWIPWSCTPTTFSSRSPSGISGGKRNYQAYLHRLAWISFPSRSQLKSNGAQATRCSWTAGKLAHHIATIHIHAAQQGGATKEEIYERIKKAVQWDGAPESGQTGLEAWRMVFVPDFPTVSRLIELTSDSLR